MSIDLETASFVVSLGGNAVAIAHLARRHFVPSWYMQGSWRGSLRPPNAAVQECVECEFMLYRSKEGAMMGFLVYRRKRTTDGEKVLHYGLDRLEKYEAGRGLFFRSWTADLVRVFDAKLDGSDMSFNPDVYQVRCNVEDMAHLEMVVTIHGSPWRGTLQRVA